MSESSREHEKLNRYQHYHKFPTNIFPQSYSLSSSLDIIITVFINTLSIETLNVQKVKQEHVFKKTELQMRIWMGKTNEHL